MSTKSSNPVLGQETIASLRRKSEQARKANEAAKRRTGRSTPKELKALAAEAKAAEKALKKAEREARQANNRETNDAISRLNNAKKGSYGSMDGSESDLKPTPKPARKSKGTSKVSVPMPPKRITAEQKATAEKSKANAAAFIKSEQMKNAQQYSADTTENYDTESMIKRKPASKKLLVSPKGKAKVFDYTKKYTEEADDDYDPKSMKKQLSTKKKRDRLFGLDFLPEIDSKEGGDKVNLPFGLGSYETLPQEEDYSKNKKGGRIKYKSGGRMRKAGCKRGMGKALRGY